VKKFFSLLLVVILLISGVPCFAQEVADTTNIDILPYEPNTTLFSFASDTFHNGPTFKGAGGTNSFYSGAEVDLVVDLNNDSYGGLVTILSNLSLKAETYDYQVFNFGSQYLHAWKVYSEMTFSHANFSSNSPILGIGFKEGVLTSWSSSPNTLGETMTLQNSQSADPSIYMQAYPLLNGIGIPSYYLNTSKDVAFTFTNIRSNYNGNADNLVNIDSEGKFKDDWKCEGSFSASAINYKIGLDN
jgi:hypothetical protein